MKIICNTIVLAEACNIVQRGVPQKSTLPATEGILLNAKNSKLTVDENVGTAGIGGITKLTTGNNSALNITGALLGSNLNSTVTIGKNSTAAFGSIDFSFLL